MANERSTASYLSVAMTSTGMTENTSENTVTPSSPGGIEFYVHLTVVILGIMGIASNGIVLYALVASGQHKKNILIVYQNVLDCVTSLFAMIIHFIQLFDIYLTGSLGYWLCTMLFSGMPVSLGTEGSVIIIAAITIDRYLKIVHSAWSQKILRNKMVYRLAMLIAISVSFASVLPVFSTTATMDGVCYAYMIWNSATARIMFFMWNFLSFYVLMLSIFIFCYWRILIVIRRQASVMAGHSAAGPSASAQTQSNQALNNVVSTMILVSTLYAISRLPGYICFLLLNLYPYPLPLESIFTGTTLLEMSYICISNPLIYAANFNPVKKVLLRMIRCQEETTANATARTGTGT